MGMRIYIVFLILLATWSGGCSKKSDPNSLAVAIPQGPTLLDPRLATDAEGMKIGELLYDGLVGENERVEATPHLARRWEQIDPLRFRFYLLEDATFTNGQPVRAQDVACTFQFIRDPENKSPFRGEFEKFTIEILNDSIFDLVLREPFAPIFVLLKKGIVSCDGLSGSGPYRLTENKTDRRVVLEGRDHHFAGTPKMRRLVFEIVKDDLTRVLKLMKGEVDLIPNGVPPALVNRLLQEREIEKIVRTGSTFAYIGINLKDPVLQNKKVRQALAYAVNRSEIINHLWKGMAEPADTLLNPNHWAFAKIPAYEHDLERAKSFLATSPLPADFELVLKTSTNKQRIEIAQMLAHQFASLGIKTRVKTDDWGIFFQDILKGNYQAYTLSWVGVTEPDLYYNILHSGQIPPDGNNRNFYRNTTVDRLVAQGRITFGEKKRAPIYAQVQEILHDELPFIPLWYENNVTFFRRGLSGVTVGIIPNYRFLAGVEKIKK